MSNFCQQGDITKIFIVDTGNSGTTSVDIYVTGGTYSNGTLYLTRNDGVTIPVPGFLFTGNTSASCIGNLYISNLYACNVPQDNNTPVDPDDPFPPPSPVIIPPPPTILVWDPIKSFSPISATTFYGDGSNLTGIRDFYVTGGTFNSNTGILTLNRQNGSTEITGFTFTNSGSLSGDTYVTGFTFTNGNTLTIFRNQGLDPLPVILNDLTLTGLTVVGAISASTYLNLPPFITGFTDNFITGGTYLNGTLTLNRQNGFVEITGFSTSINFTGNTSASCITDLYVSNLYGCSPITIHDSINALSLISATTYYGDGSNLTGVPNFYITGGTFSAGTLTLTNNYGNPITVTGFTITSTGGITADTFVTGFTYNNANILTLSQNNGQPPLNVTINNFTGLTVNGSLSASTYLGLPPFITGFTDNFVTGGTYSNGTLILNRQNGLVTIPGFLTGTTTDTFVTGFTFSSNTLTITQNQGQAPLTASITTIDLANIFSAVTFNIGTTGSISASTFFGSGANLTGIPNFYITGGTFSAGTLTLTNNYGNPITVTGFTTTSTSGGITADTFVTGFTYNGINQLTISQNQGQSPLNVTINNLTLTGLTVNGSLSATTYFGSGANLTNIPDNFVTGGTYTSVTGTLTLNRQNGVVTITGFTTGSSVISGDTYVTGFTYNDANRLTISQNEGKADLNVFINTFTGLTVNGSISATTYFGSGANLTNIPDNFVTGGTYTSATGILTLNRQNGSVTVTGFTDNFVTGGTFNSSNRVLTLNRQNGTFNISGITDTFVTGFTYSSNNLTINQSQGQTPLTVNISTMTGLTINGDLSTTNLTVTSTSNLNGTINSTNLAGTGARVVQVNSGGTFSASNQIITAYLTSGSTNANILETTNNWDINGVFIGSGITGTYQGQKFYNNNYFFEAVDNDLWIRLIRG